ncbi:hypothetical protein ACN9MH_07960 [Paenibacillus silvae]|uniref:hypothetical protein n=1 Tax=Paenibacillus silvae TaxID=1325358 RepID=UPI0025A2380F|nr:hypothetical protein [Paenibacillus silvae]MDM5279084.1 hypothetical protein [Paenibacillus silvae]
MVRDEINRMLDVLPENELNVARTYIEMVHRKYMYQKTLEDKAMHTHESMCGPYFYKIEQA